MEINRQTYMHLLLTTSGLGEYISGAILADETLNKSTTDGKTFIDILKDQNIMPRINVDEVIMRWPSMFSNMREAKMNHPKGFMVDDHQVRESARRNHHQVPEGAIKDVVVLIADYLQICTHLEEGQLYCKLEHNTRCLSSRSRPVISGAAVWWMCGVGSSLSGWTAFRRNPGAR